MGILDDAIREHLELKRAHGASDDEIRNKEAEVFGPARHDAPEVAVEAPEVAVETPVEAPVEAPLGEAPIEEHVEPVPEDPYVVHPGDHAVPDPHHEGEPGGSDPAWGEDTEFFSEPQQPPAHAHAEERHPALHDTDEHFRGEQHPPEPVFQQPEPPREEPAGAPEAPVSPTSPVEGDEDEESEDVLEETPEFLQDAPEHDRLWFEQKPPRDFDFGE